MRAAGWVRGPRAVNLQLTLSSYITDTGAPGAWYFGGCVDVVAHDPAANNCTASPIVVTVVSVLVFGDDFESGTTGAWSFLKP